MSLPFCNNNKIVIKEMTDTLFDEFLYDTIQVIIILEVVSLINLHTSFLDYLLPESINDSLTQHRPLLPTKERWRWRWSWRSSSQSTDSANFVWFHNLISIRMTTNIPISSLYRTFTLNPPKIMSLSLTDTVTTTLSHASIYYVQVFYTRRRKATDVRPNIRGKYLRWYECRSYYY